MEARQNLTLDLWREIGRHPRLALSAEPLLRLLHRHWAVEGLMVGHLDGAGRRVEISAWAGPEPRPALPEPLAEAEWAALVAWCAAGRVESDEVPAWAARFRLPLPAGEVAGMLAAGLAREGRALGLLVLGFAGPRPAGLANFMSDLLEAFPVALDNDRELRELTRLREAAEADRQSLLHRLRRVDVSDTVVGDQGGLKAVLRRVDLVAPSDTPVLILGETGSGKEVVARAVHRRSRRADGPFIRVNCGAIPPELIDSELFGHEKGSFTGAVAARKGWFERADGGTLFLDEVGELSPAAQVRLLRILQDGSFQRVGAQQASSVDVRVVAATNRDLHSLVAEGGFREDLWYRLAVFPIHLPALRERPEDIPELARHFAGRAAERLGLALRLPGRDDLELLAAYPWPGNVRELASVMERAAILGEGHRLELAKALGVPPPPPSLKPRTTGPASPLADSHKPTAGDMRTTGSLDEVARRHIEGVLAQCLGRVEGPFGAARQLGINPNTLRGRMRRLGIEPGRFRGGAGV